MKNLILFLMMLMVPQSFAQTTANTQTEFEYLNSPVNMIINPYARLNTVQAASGGSASKGRATGANELMGKAAHTCSMNTLDSYCQLNARVATAPYNSSNARCEVSIWYNGANANLTSLAFTPPSGVDVIIPLKSVTGTSYAQAWMELPCEAGQGLWRLKQTTAGTTGTIKYGGYYGPSTRTGSKSEDLAVFSADRTSGPILVANQTTTPIPSFNAILKDNYGCSNGAGGCVIKKAGTYNATARVSWVMNANGARILRVLKNGNSPNDGCNAVFNSYTGGAPNQHDLQCTFDANVGDVITLAVWQNIGAGLYLDNTYSGSAFASLNLSQVTGAASVTTATVDNQDFDWKSYTPAITSDVGTFATYTINYAQYAKIGGKFYLKGKITFTNASSWTTPRIPLPSGFTVLNPGNAVTNKVDLNDISDTVYHGRALVSSTSIGLYSMISGSADKTTTVTQAVPATWTTGDNFSWLVGPLDVAENGIAWTQSPSGLINIDVPVYTVTRLTSGSGTYTPPAGVKWLEVEMVGGGSGGGGSGGAGTGALGNPGTATTFGTSLLTALPNGGAATVNSPAQVIHALAGAPGGYGQYSYNTNTVYLAGGYGGSTPLGAGGVPQAGSGAAAAVNSGAGGAGGRADPSATGFKGGDGGSSGAYIRAIIPLVSGSYPYVVGAAGAGGAAGTSGNFGGSGGAGVIIIKEHYTNFTPALASGLLQRLPGAVTSNAQSALRIEYVAVEAPCPSSPCTIARQSGGFTSVTRLGTGHYSINWPAETWSSAPICTYNTNRKIAFWWTWPTTTKVEIKTEEPIGTALDGTFHMTCIGPR